MALYKYSSSKLTAGIHAMIIARIEWKKNKPTNNVQVIEANYGSTFAQPTGQIPWERNVAGGRNVTISDIYKVVTLE